MYVRNMINIKTYFKQLWLTLYQQVVKVIGDGYKGSVEENISRFTFLNNYLYKVR